MKPKIHTNRLYLLGFAIVIATAGYLLYSHNYGPIFTPPPQFQPEAQMLSQAIQPGANTGNATTSYAYDDHVCINDPSGQYPCFSSYYKNLVATKGVDAAFADIKIRYNKNAFIESQCHPLMHTIGQAAAKLYPVVSEAYLHGDSFCWSGYYHGILEGVALRVGKSNFESQLNTICADIPGKATYSFDYYNCLHGLGHGVMELNEDDVFASLKACDVLTGLWEQESCYSGVFMENIIAESINHTSKYLKASDFLYPCDAVDSKYKSECYLGQTSYALEKSNYDFTKVSALCGTVEEPFRDICYQSFGRDAANQAQHDSQKTSNTCSLGITQNDVQNCIVGAVKEFISYYHSDAQAKTFCDIINKSNQAGCLSTTEQYYKQF